MHDQSLRKGAFAVDLGYENNCDRISAVDARAGIHGDAILLKLTLKPIDENQRIDEEYFHSHNLAYIQITEKQVLKQLRSFARTHPEPKRIRLEIASQGRSLLFDVQRVTVREDYFMQLDVRPEHSAEPAPAIPDRRD